MPGESGGMPQGDWQSQLGAILNSQPDRSAPVDASPLARNIPQQAVPRRESGLAGVLAAGRHEGIANQPFRRGYQTQIEDEDQLITHDMPPIYPNYGPPPENTYNQGPAATPIQNAFADELTPRTTGTRRRRQPAAVEE